MEKKARSLARQITLDEFAPDRITRQTPEWQA